LGILGELVPLVALVLLDGLESVMIEHERRRRRFFA
jgi:hypothetical protein